MRVIWTCWVFLLFKLSPNYIVLGTHKMTNASRFYGCCFLFFKSAPQKYARTK